MTKARDWMLFLPFLSNYLVKVIDTIEDILITRSMYYSSSSKKSSGYWEKSIVVLTHNCLDFIQFIHEKTVAQTPAEFPVSYLSFLFFYSYHSNYNNYSLIPKI